MTFRESEINDTVYPVILAVPGADRRLTGREKAAALSKHARRALEVSAGRYHVNLSYLPKDDEGVPLPVEGNYWSLTHKPDYVGGVVSRSKIGIDIEKIRPFSPGLYRKTGNDDEWFLSKGDARSLFFRYWTAKEAVLKASGTGVKDLLACRIKVLIDDTHLIAAYRNEPWLIEHIFFDGHIASVTRRSNRIQWLRL